MKILVTGASGFIGSHIVSALQSRGDEVVACVRNPETFSQQFPEITAIKVDYNNNLSPDIWKPRLQDIDAVVNAVGIIRETRSQKFRPLHTEAPMALFEAAAQSGVQNIVQISALGADETAATGYHKSKKAADDFLRQSPVQHHILRPSLVLGLGGDATAMFLGMAALPIIPLIGNGGQLMQPIHIDDLSRAVLHRLDQQEGANPIDIVGPEPLSMKELLLRLRNWLGKRSTIPIPSPVLFARIGAKLGDWLEFMPLTTETLGMLLAGSTGNHDRTTERLGFAPMGLNRLLQTPPDEKTIKAANRYFL